MPWVTHKDLLVLILYVFIPVDDVPPLFKDKKSGPTIKNTDHTVKQTKDFKTSDITEKKTEDINENQKPEPITNESKPSEEQPLEIPEEMEMIVAETQFTESENPTSCQETPTKDQPTMSHIRDTSTAPKDMTSQLKNMASPVKDATSPDVIPSSQLSSESSSSFTSLGRSKNAPFSNMAVLLNDVTDKDETLKGITQYNSPQKTKPVTQCNSPQKTNPVDKEKTTVTETREKESETKVDENSDVQSDINADKNKKETIPQILQPTSSKSSAKKTKNTMKLTNKTSPVSGRTRRSLQLKITPKKQTKITEVTRKTEERMNENNLEKDSTESSSETQDNIDDNAQSIEDSENQESTQDDTEQENAEKPCHKQEGESRPTPSTSLQNEIVSSPVSCAKIKFMRPSTESPTHTSLKRIHSPVASPTTSILKRSSGRYDSPSPPNKVTLKDVCIHIYYW